MLLAILPIPNAAMMDGSPDFEVVGGAVVAAAKIRRGVVGGMDGATSASGFLLLVLLELRVTGPTAFVGRLGCTFSFCLNLLEFARDILPRI